MIPLKTQAIQTALMGDWEKAVLLNQELLKSDPDDIDTLNRLAYAYTILGKVKEAKNAYKKVLGIDYKNPIALKNLKRLTETSSQQTSSTTQTLYTNNMFLEEHGKTKIVELVNLADSKVISLLRTGEALTLQIKRSKIFALDGRKQYVGMLPDDVAHRLIRFMTGGNEYSAYVKAAQVNKVTIFVRETKRVARFKNQPSFISISKNSKGIFDNTLKKNQRFAKRSEELEDFSEE